MPRAPRSGARAGDRRDDLVAVDLLDRAGLRGVDQPIELLQDGPERQHHVVARVAVGDREHVQVVDLLTPVFERGEEVNDLNVFPVADGDTGDNMVLTLRSVLQELDRLVDASEARPVEEINRDEIVASVARAALLGARGNSGVILSQLIRGAAEELASVSWRERHGPLQVSGGDRELRSAPSLQSVDGRRGTPSARSQSSARRAQSIGGYPFGERHCARRQISAWRACLSRRKARRVRSSSCGRRSKGDPRPADSRQDQGPQLQWHSEATQIASQGGDFGGQSGGGPAGDPWRWPRRNLRRRKSVRRKRCADRCAIAALA